MPAKFQVPLFYNFDDRYWTASVSATAAQVEEIDPIPHYSTVDFAVTFCAGGVATTLTAPEWTGGIKVKDDFSGTYLVQLSSPTLVGTVYTFSMLIDSTELRAALLSPQNQYAFEIHEATSGISTLVPIFFSISRSYTLTGASPTSASGTLVVAATKTVTFPLSLTFPNANGTNGFSLTYGTNGVLAWASSGALTDGNKNDITVTNSAGTWTIDPGVVTLAKMANIDASAGIKVLGRSTASSGVPQVLSTSGTGNVAMTNAPTFVDPILGNATASTFICPAIEIPYGSTGLDFVDSANDNAVIIVPPSGDFGTNKTLTLPNVTGTFVVAATSATATQALFAQSSGFPAYRAIATGDLPSISSGLTGILPGANGGTGVANTSKTITLGASLTTTGAGAATYALGASTQTYTFPTVTATLASLTGTETLTNKTFTAPVLGAATATSINGITITAGSGTLDIGSATVEINGSDFYTAANFTVGGAFYAGSSVTIASAFATTGTNPVNLAFGNGAGVTHTFPVASSSLAATTDITGGTLAGSFTTLTASGLITANGGITLGDAQNIAFGTTTGTKIGAATTQKLAFWNTTPIVQPTTAIAGATVVHAGGGTAIKTDDTFDGYTLAQVVKALRNAGLLA